MGKINLKNISMNHYVFAGNITLIFCMIVVFIVASSIPANATEQKELVRYNQKGKFSYLVQLKPSYLYGPPPQVQLPDPQYPVAAIKSIDFTYSFITRESGVESVSIEAVLENPGIWQKTTPLVSQSVSNNFTMPFSLDPEQINSLFAQIEKEIAVSESPRHLTLKISVSSEKYNWVQRLPIKIDENLIEISNSLVQSFQGNTGSVSYVIKRQAPPVQPPPPLSVFRYPAELVRSANFSVIFGDNSSPSVPISLRINTILKNADIWQKTLELVPPTPVRPGSATSFVLDLESIQKQFDDIDAVTKIITSPRVIVIKVSVDTPEGIVTQSHNIYIENKILEIPGTITGDYSVSPWTWNCAISFVSSSGYDTSALQPGTNAPEAAALPASVFIPYDIVMNSVPPPDETNNSILPADMPIFTKLVNNINVRFNYQFKSDQTVSGLNTELGIAVRIEAPQSWSKTFNLLTTTKKGSFDVDFPFDISSYMDLIDSIRNETGLAPDSYNIYMVANLHTIGQTQFGQIDELLTHTLKGTVKGSTLQWDKEVAIDQPGSIKTSQIIPNKFLGLSIWIVKVLSGLFIILLVPSAIIYARRLPNMGRTQRELHLIMKKYGQRILETKGSEPMEAGSVISLKSISDLIKVSEDLGKPILHDTPAQAEPEGVDQFYVIDGNIRYQYTIKQSDIQAE
jgi:hypothetical protein